MRIDVVSIFPGLVKSVAQEGMTRRAIEQGQMELHITNPRDFTDDNYRRTDDRPYGGGPGMVMLAEPLARALDSITEDDRTSGPVIYFSPQGEPLCQSMVEELATWPRLVLLAGRYEGVDERLLETRVDREISIGDYVLSGGELAAMVVIDAVVRMLPGVLGNEQSAKEDSFSNGLLDFPHYTRPEEFEGLRVPEVLAGGNHELIRRWRLKQALGRTWLRRPDLLETACLDEEASELLLQFQKEQLELEKLK